MVTGPEAACPVTENGMMRAASPGVAMILLPETRTPAGEPQSPTTRSVASPPDQSTLPLSTSTPVSRSSRSAAVSTVSETTGKSGTRWATTLTTRSPRAVLPDDDSTS